MKIGAILEDGACRFTVWAPVAPAVGLVLEMPGESHKRRIAMEKDGSGYWHAFVADARPGSRYFFSLNGCERADPASHYQPLGVFGPSEVIDHSSFKWNDKGWKGLAPGSLVIYEVHTGTFTRAGDFGSIITRLDELKELGINALELMPVAQFPGKRNWGYDGVFPFAVQNSYGGPLALKRLVDECHKRGIAVVLDVVYNHLGPEGNYIADFGPYFTERYKTPWGAAINFDGPESDHVRNYFVENALYWFERFHMDALRLDAVHAIIDMSAFAFLAFLKKKTAEFSLDQGRAFHLFAESDLNDTKLVSTGEYGYGLDALWCDDFHHSIHALLTGERNGYYADFGSISHLARSLNDGFVYSGQYSAYRKRSFGSPSALIPKERFIVSVQNHDQAGNRMLGERLAKLTSFDGLKLSAGLLLLSPYIPLIFMGEEYGEDAPFLYFVDHGNEELIQAIREGRKKEFEEFQWQGEPPMPDSPETFHASMLRWESRRSGHKKTLLDLYRALIEMRRSIPALGVSSEAVARAWGSEEEKIVFLLREKKDSAAFALFSFNRDTARIPVPFPPGRWTRKIDSAGPEWDGPGGSLPAAGEGGAEQEVNPLSFALYIRERA
ncbi:MAG: malto-oligosyltrehalose trehalohydrolase [Deltaproteobacteria bacterium GWC2_55_46]|nr:MAG: malto-oligosyltrehalose trehalohydrolase [Deltaproteobacteria bacterium GWA2_55_82]OGQ63125.1 MAG: malto-oligosyltrehalose trehalohydrolase [Deltaproteobacteria bacterium RIFCSPLOWO2_02_FULL_55_12]OIJ73589.1 MAG: malto-oligosyltrehalose trehalohydrolase [Deltaproteobacteria bacterium GWC2_55_46]